MIEMEKNNGKTFLFCSPETRANKPPVLWTSLYAYLTSEFYNLNIYHINWIKDDNMTHDQVIEKPLNG